MDPFEARLQFKQLLTTLNPSYQAIQKVISFALKNHELHVDLHSVMMDRLEQLDLNSRMNVLFFIEGLISSVFWEFGNKEEDGPKPYVDNLLIDFYNVLEKVVVKENLVNLSSAAQILQNVGNCYKRNHFKGFEIPTEPIDKYEALTIDNLRKEFSSNEIVKKKIEDSTTVFEKCWFLLILMKRISLINRFNQINNINEEEDSQINIDALKPLSKEQINNRMESDRERHKKFKESNWIVSRPSQNIDEHEFSKIWDQYNELNDVDCRDIDELNQIVKESYQL